MALVLSLPLFADVAPRLTSSNAAVPPPRIASIAPFGTSYVRHAFPVDLAGKAAASSGAADGAQRAAGKRDMGDRKRNVKLDEADLAMDWYEYLKLPNAEGSTDDQIKTAYRKRCLDTHPDKQPDGSDVEFKRVQRAFEILGNPEARRSYDSSRPFDDSVPPENVKEENFYTTFAPVFERNKKWSAVPEVPSLGDETTPLTDVKRFYDEWRAFRSWRDFSNEVELQEIDEGMMREEKRYYQRENQRLLDKMNQAELKRVRSLVDRAMKNDPRLRRAREAEDAARQQALAQRAAARAKTDDSAIRAKVEAEERQKKEAEAQKQQAVDSKTRLRNAVKDMADFFKANGLMDTLETNKLLSTKVRRPNIQWVLNNCNADEAVTIRDLVLAAPVEVEATPPPKGSSEEPDATSHVPAVLIFNLELQATEGRVGRNRYGEATKKVAIAAGISSPTKPEPKKFKTTYSDEELIALQKLAIKFPGGCTDRWGRIAAAMHNKFTEEDILEQVKIIEADWKAGKPPAASETRVPEAPSSAVDDDWTPKQQKALENGLRDLKDYKEKDKFTKLAAFVEGKTPKQCFDRFKFLCAMNKK
jgi:DnaJ family protein C protein 2